MDFIFLTLSFFRFELFFKKILSFSSDLFRLLPRMWFFLNFWGFWKCFSQILIVTFLSGLDFFNFHLLISQNEYLWLYDSECWLFFSDFLLFPGFDFFSKFIFLRNFFSDFLLFSQFFTFLTVLDFFLRICHFSQIWIFFAFIY